MSTWEPPAAGPPHSSSGAPGLAADPAAARGAGALDALLDVSMPVVIEMGRTSLTVQQVLELAAGSVIELEKLVGEPVDVYVSDRKLAQGEIVVVGEHFGVRITRVLPSPAEGTA